MVMIVSPVTLSLVSLTSSISVNLKFYRASDLVEQHPELFEWAYALTERNMKAMYDGERFASCLARLTVLVGTSRRGGGAKREKGRK